MDNFGQYETQAVIAVGCNYNGSDPSHTAGTAKADCQPGHQPEVF
jgi:hypothetical protein